MHLAMKVQQQKKTTTGQYLSWHDFSIGSTDLNPSIQAGSVVRLHYVSSICLICSHSTIIGP